MLNSSYKQLVPVIFPPYQGRQKYMHTFSAERPEMAPGFENYEGVCLDLLGAAGVQKGPVHMTVDEKIVLAGMSQRRPGPHLDGCYFPSDQAWGGGGGGWLHYCNILKGEPYRRMAVIVAATVAGCRVWRGLFRGEPKDDGDLEHIRDQLDQAPSEILQPYYGYHLSADCVHESLIYERPTQRQFIRLAFHV